MERWKLTTAACILGLVMSPVQEVAAQKGLFDDGGLFDEIGKGLDDAGKELDNAKPLIDQKGKDLKKLVDENVKDGFLNLQSINDEIESTVDDLKGELDDVLSDENIKNLESFLDGLDEQALESIKDGILEDLKEQLELTEDQVDKAIPILKSEIDKRGKMLEQFLTDKKKGFKDFKKQSAGLLQETLKSLDDVLTADQLKEFKEFGREAQKRIRDLFKELKIDK